MIQTGQRFQRVVTGVLRGIDAWSTRRRESEDDWPESANVAVGAALLGTLVWLAFTTRVPDMERLPAEVVFAFLGLYFYSAGFLSGRRTGQMGSGGWAGAACGLAFGIVVCIAMYNAAMTYGVREAVRSGSIDQVAIAVSGLGFFIVMGALCGALGARGAIRSRRPPTKLSSRREPDVVVPPSLHRRRW